MKNVTTYVVFIGLALGLFFITTNSAKAETQCEFQSDIAILSDIQKNQNADYLEQLRAELAVRKNMLNRIISCALQDTKNLTTSLKNIDPGDASSRTLRNQYVDRLTQIDEHYEAQKKRIDDLGLYGTKEFSRNLKEWRASHEAPVMQEAQNFVFWAKNQSLISTAQIRFQKISQTVTLLRLAENEEMKDLFNEASLALRDAQNQNMEAKRVMESHLSATEALAALKLSLSSLATTYQTFFDLSEILQKLLPH